MAEVTFDGQTFEVYKGQEEGIQALLNELETRRAEAAAHDEASAAQQTEAENLRAQVTTLKEQLAAQELALATAAADRDGHIQALEAIISSQAADLEGVTKALSDAMEEADAAELALSEADRALAEAMTPLTGEEACRAWAAYGAELHKQGYHLLRHHGRLHLRQHIKGQRPGAIGPVLALEVRD